MKKLILLFTLLSGVALAQIPFPAYLPINSSRSATIGTIRTNSLVVTASTISVGAKTLTSGNTGTVAVLSDAVFAYDFKCAASINPADATSYYFSNMNNPSWVTSASANSILMPYNATLIGYHINYIVNGVTGTAESGTLAITASGSSTNIVTNLDFTGAANSYTSSALSVPVVAGDLISARLITPTWVTDPTNIRMGITFLFVRRS